MSAILLLLLSYIIIVVAASSTSSTKLPMFTSSSCRSKIVASTRQRSPITTRLFRSSLLPSAAFISPLRAARAFTSHATRSHSATKVYQNMIMGFGNSDEPNNSNGDNNNVDETSKWEALYNNYQPQSSPIIPSNTPPPSSTAQSNKSEIKIITFDLDNTLWKTSETITHANTVLFEQLQANYGIDTRSEVEMGKLFKEFPDRYCGLLDDKTDGSNFNGGGGSDAEYANSVENVGRTDTTSTSPSPNKDDDGVHISTQSSGSSKKKKKPVYLTLLRKDAIRSLILQQQQQRNGDMSLSPIQLEEEVDAAFQVWMEARTQSISENFAPFALETLSRLKSSLAPAPTTTTANQSKKVYIGAITDGNSNPQSVPELSGLFDFVIRAEDVGVSKPDKRVYKAAVAELMVQLMRDGLSVEEFFLGEQFVNEGGAAAATADANYLMSDLDSMQQEPSWKDVDPEAVEAFSEAVGPWWVHIGDDFFKDIVAAKELRMRSVWVRELIGGAKAFGGGNQEATDSTTKRSVEDLVNDIAKNNGALTMAIGDSDFLTSALHEEFSDAILDRFADLSDLLIQWNEEGNGNEEEVDYDYSNTESTSEAYSIVMPSVEPPTQNDESESGATKFCFACGEKIPAVAKFCPGCGERQSS